MLATTEGGSSKRAAASPSTPVVWTRVRSRAVGGNEADIEFEVRIGSNVRVCLLRYQGINDGEQGDKLRSWCRYRDRQCCPVVDGGDGHKSPTKKHRSFMLARLTNTL